MKSLRKSKNMEDPIHFYHAQKYNKISWEHKMSSPNTAFLWTLLFPIITIDLNPKFKPKFKLIRNFGKV